jgi:hypothetical protein
MRHRTAVCVIRNPADRKGRVRGRVSVAWLLSEQQGHRSSNGEVEHMHAKGRVQRI